MPLIQGKSKEAFGKNVAKEIDAGKPRDQSLAIAYNIRKKMARKMAKGGMIDKEHVDKPTAKNDMYASGGTVSSNNNFVGTGQPSLMDQRRNQIANAFGNKPKKMAEGGMVEDEDLDPMFEPEHGAEAMMRKQMDYSRKAQEHEDLPHPSEPTYMEEPAEEDMPAHMMAHGGMIKEIMKKRMMANGGMVEYPGKDHVASGTYPSSGMGKTRITNLGDEEDMDQNENFLSDEEQDPFAHHNDFDEFKEKPRRRSILDSIMRGR